MNTDNRFASLAEAMKTIAERSRDRETMARLLFRAAMSYPKLLLELLGFGEQLVMDRCRAHVDRHLRQADHARPDEAPRAAAAEAVRSLHTAPAAKILPTLPRRRVNPERKKEQRSRDARAQLVRDLAQSAAGVDPAVATKHARETIDTALALARREFDERIVANVDVRWGDLTMEHLDSLEINVAFLAELRECMRELRDAGRFPDEKTPLREILSPEEMRAIKERCYAKREAAQHAVRMLRISRG